MDSSRIRKSEQTTHVAHSNNAEKKPKDPMLMKQASGVCDWAKNNFPMSMDVPGRIEEVQWLKSLGRK